MLFKCNLFSLFIFLLILNASCVKNDPLPEPLAPTVYTIFEETFTNDSTWLLESDTCKALGDTLIRGSASLQNQMLTLDANQEEPCCSAHKATKHLPNSYLFSTIPDEIVFSFELKQLSVSGMGNISFTFEFFGYQGSLNLSEIQQLGLVVLNVNNTGYRLRINNNLISTGSINYMPNNRGTEIYSFSTSACGADNFATATIQVSDFNIQGLVFNE